MSEINITVEGGTSYRLHTAGKFCDRDIVVTAEGGVDTSSEDMLVTAEHIDEYRNSRVTSIAGYAFYNRDIKNVYFPLVKSVGDYAFYNASMLRVEDDQFPLLETIGLYSFKQMDIRVVKLSRVKKIGDNAFETCQSLDWVECPMAEIISANAFDACTSLHRILFPMAEEIGNEAFRECGNLTNVALPSLKKVWYKTFFNCTNLEIVDLPVCSGIDSLAFENCTKLKAVVLRTTDTVCVADLDAFEGTPLVSGQGYIYVPTAMYEYYREGYEPVLNQLMPGFFDIMFRKIEDYTVDGTVTGELDESKI